jgi:hypothetical protein
MQSAGVNSFEYAILVENTYIGENITTAINANLRIHIYFILDSTWFRLSYLHGVIWGAMGCNPPS